MGASGHARMIADAIRASPDQVLVAFCDESSTASEFLGHPVLEGERALRAVLAEDSGLRLVVGIGDNWTRQQLVESLEEAEYTTSFARVVHPSAVVANDVSIGVGSVIAAGTVLNSGTWIGGHCILNTSASVDHDCRIDDFATVAPGAVLGGGVHAGQRSVVSLGANVIHGISVGVDSVVGAGSVVLHDIPERVVAYGVPARIIRSREPWDPYL